MISHPSGAPQSNLSTDQENVSVARAYLRLMLGSDAHVAMHHNAGRWDQACRALHAAHEIGGREAARKAFNTLCKDDPSLITLVSTEERTIPAPVAPVPSTIPPLAPVPSATPPAVPVPSTTSPVELSSAPGGEHTTNDAPSTSLAFKPLPPEARVAEELGTTASPWLDAYIDFSKKWSPRGYEGFHEATALWILSTVAAHRVMLPMGDKYYTPLLIVLVGRTGLFAKSTTAKIGRAILKSANLDWFLAPDDATPQKFISEMAGYIPGNYGSMSPKAQEQCENQLAFAGQRGWFYDEFGQIIASILKEGIMSDFRGILRRLDDCYDCYKYATISRGVEIVDNPYLALLGSMTPDDLGKAAKSGSSLWGDGFLARFAFVTPPAGTSGIGRFPEGLRVVPESLSTHLRVWHTQLGIPPLVVTPILDKRGNPTDQYKFERGPLPEQRCKPGRGVMEAYYTYSDALISLRAATNKNRDLDGNYIRFASKALRIAMLLASLENDGHIELRHWARGQAISERWRANVHELFAQANEASADENEIMEEKILAIIEKLKQASVREIRQRIYGIDAIRLRAKVQDLAQAGMLEEVTCDKTIRYRLPAPSAPVEA